MVAHLLEVMMARWGGSAACVMVAVSLMVGCASSEEQREAPDDAEVDQALRSGAPRYTLHSSAIFGEYESDEGCPGGFDACDRITVEEKDGKVRVRFGNPEWNDFVADAWNGNGVVLFSVDGIDGDCDDPGCGNLEKISGVIYGVQKNGRWVPAIKATYTAQFDYPEDDDSPSGSVKTVLRFAKR